MAARRAGRWRWSLGVIGGLALGGCSEKASGSVGAAATTATTGSAVAAPSSSIGGKYAAKQVAVGEVVGQEQVDALNKGAMQALEQHDYEGAIEKAKKSALIDQASAFPYLYWGTALIEQDRRTEARKVFIDCMRFAKHGPRNECQKFLE